MDEIGQFIETFRARATSSARSKLDALLDLERFEDPRVLRFLLDVLADKAELAPVRIHVLKRLRNGNIPPINRPAIAEVMLRVLSDDSGPDLRMQAALALAEFADIPGVPTRLGSLALDPDQTIDLRFSAFTSLQRAGPSTECVAVLRQLLADESLGPSARRVLSLWRLA
jgi:hypothetical protein